MSNPTPLSSGLGIDERLNTPVSQWKLALASHGKALRVALPGIVTAFDATQQTVTVQPAISEVNSVGGVPTTQPLPLLVNVPVVLPRAGGYTLTLPIAVGDEVLVIFGDSCMDAWHQLGGEQNQFERRRHSLADGFAIPGPWSQPRVLASYSAGSAQLRNDAGTVVVDIAASQITLTAPTVQVNASSAANVTAPTVNVTASSQVNISGAGHTSIEGKDFLTHKHTGVATGGGTSGPVL
jgi:hypothetical protein